MNLLLTILLTGAVATNGVVAAGGVRTENASAVALPSWAGSMIASWSLNQVNPTAAGTCGSSCDLTAAGDYTTDTGDYQQSTASGLLDGTGDYASCTGTTCSDLNRTTSTTWGGWYKVDANSSYEVYSRMDASNGYALEVILGAATYCVVRSSGTTKTGSGPSNSRTGTWFHSACAFDSSGATITSYDNGSSAGGAPGTSASLGATAAIDSKVGAGPSYLNLDGHIDDMWVYAGAMAAASICRICSCNVDGAACSCSSLDSTVWLSTGRKNSSCNGCTLPSDCSQSAP